jgi:hypothetical protein
LFRNLIGIYKKGRFTARFFKEGAFKEVEVDDRLPFGYDGTLGCTSVTGN